MKDDILQLTYVKEEEALLHPLGCRRMVEIPSVPMEIGGDFPEIGHPLFRLEKGPDGGVCASWGGRTLALVSGTEFTVDGWVFRFYRKHPAAALSGWGLFLSRMSKGLVFFFLLLQVWVMFGLQQMVLRSGVWENSYARLQVVEKLDAVRHRLAKMKGKTPFAATLLKELQEDMDSRVRYIKMYDDRMRRSQRRAMYEDCIQLEKVLDLLERNEQLSSEPPPPDIEEAVQRILRQNAR